MRFINPGHAHAMVGGVWEPLTGPFPTIAGAEGYIDSPPNELGDPGTVTIKQTFEGWVIMAYREPKMVSGQPLPRVSIAA